MEEEGHNFAYETLREVKLTQAFTSPDKRYQKFQKDKNSPAEHQNLISYQENVLSLGLVDVG